MKRIDEKVAISGDGAELIQSYLNELNMKLLAAGITESYSIVMEAEILFIAEINDLNKKTKVTVYEVQKIIEKYGTPDEIVKRYKLASEAEIDEEFYSMDLGNKKLIKRTTNKWLDRSNFNFNIQKVKDASVYSIKLITLLLPPLLFTIALINLNLYKGDFIVFVTIIDIAGINNPIIISFIVLGLVLFAIQEIITGLDGKLILSIRNTIIIRNYNRSIIFAGFLASLWIYQLRSHSITNFRTSKVETIMDLPYSESVLALWIVCFIIIESLILSRDHISSFYPLQPRLTSFQSFIKIHYILAFMAIITMTIFSSNNSLNTLFISMIIAVIATLVTFYKNYNPGFRFYLSMQMIPLIGMLYLSIAKYFMYSEALFTLIIISTKYRNEIIMGTRQVVEEIRIKTTQFINLVG